MEPTTIFRVLIHEAPRGVQARIARALDVSPQLVSQWAKGPAAPDPKWWPLVESAIGCEPFTMARATGLADHLGLDDLPDDAARAERWAALYPLDGRTVAPAQAVNTTAAARRRAGRLAEIAGELAALGDAQRRLVAELAALTAEETTTTTKAPTSARRKAKATR